MAKLFTPRLTAILLTALAFRLGWTLARPAEPASLKDLPDQREYFELGSNLLHRHILVFHDDRFHQDVYAFRTPGYPLLVALCGASMRGIRIIQAFIDTSTGFAIYLIARRFLSVRIAEIAVCAVVFNPYLIYFTGLILSETLFTAMLTWGICALIYRKIPLGGLILSLNVLIRPSSVLLPILLPSSAVLLNSWPRPAYQRAAITALFRIAITFLTLLPWSYRNRVQMGKWVWTTTNVGITRYDGFNPNAKGDSNQSFVTQMPELKDMNELERDHYLKLRSSEYIRSHPLRVLTLSMAKIARTWSPWPLSGQFSSWMYRIVGLAYAVPLFALAVVGLYRSVLPWPAKLLLMLPAIYFTAVHAASVGSLRYRIPVEPELAVIAASALSPKVQRLGAECR